MWPQGPDVASDSLEAAQKCRAEQGLDARPAFPPGPCLPHGDLLTQRGWGGGPRGKPLLPNTPICTPSISGFLRPPARQPAIAPTSPHLLTLRPPPPGWLFSQHTPLLHCYARRSLVHHLSPPSVWERQGKGRRELGLEGGVGKSAPAWLWIRAGSACVRTEGWMMDWMSWSKERMQISGVRRSEDSENERSEVGKGGWGLSPVKYYSSRFKKCHRAEYFPDKTPHIPCYK